MKQSKIYRKLLSVALAAIMVLSLTNGLSGRNALAAESGEDGRLTWEKVENNGRGLLYESKEKAELFEENYVKDGKVRASIVLDGQATLKKYSAENIANNAGAKSYRAQLQAQQDKLAATISKEVLGGEKLDVVWNITLAANIISANIPYDKIDLIKVLPGVKDVVLEMSYQPETAQTTNNDPNMATGTEMVGSNYAWAAGYTGAGSKIAIVDTGLDREHQLFNSEAFDYAIAQTGKDVDLLTADEVAAVFSSLNAAKFLGSADGVYYNSKVPYGVNYIDRGLDFTHINDSQGEHGSHVAGIAAGNRFVSDGNGGFSASLDTVMTQGEAADAQLMIMKVFGKGGGAYDSDYMTAIEDAIILGADTVNLSLGSGNPGLAWNSTYATILNEVSQATNLVWANSAGNAYNWPQYSSVGYLYAEDVSFATGGSPATYAPTLSVASVDNKGTTGMYVEVGGNKMFYAETSGYGNSPMKTIAGEYEYIFIQGYGTEDDFAPLAELLAGKVAFCSRGSTSFFEKANAAVKNGAIATIVYNNQPGVINMNLNGYEYTAPCVSITQEDGFKVLEASTPVTDDAGNVIAYTGTITIGAAMGVNNPGEVDTYTMSTFSSWGVPGDLSLKPEITAPGGNIYSVWGANAGENPTALHDQYESMSGTSMASPQVAGLTAVLAQYIRENDLTAKTGKTQRQLALSLLMSTSEPMYDTDYEIISILNQGSGLANVNNAINAKSYVTIDEVAKTAPASSASAIQEGKVKVELGALKEDSFKAAFSLNNFSDEDVTYYLDAEFFTQWIYNDLYRTGYIDPLQNLAFAWTVDGQAYEPTDAGKYDFNADGVANGFDAQYLLEYCAGIQEELNDAEYADLDADGDIDTYDAKLAFELLNGAGLTVEAGKSAQITLTVSGLDAAFAGMVNGNYIEGFIYAQEGDSKDGALGVQHSIPVFGFYGNWTDASMYDQGSYLDYYYGLLDPNERLPYLYNVTGGTTSLYIKGFIYDGGYFFGGNPFADDLSFDDFETALYLPERNALNSMTVVDGFQYTQIRNAGAGRFFVSDKLGNLVSGTETDFGSSYSAYYYVNGATWRTPSTMTRFNFVGKNLKENKEYNLNFQLAPEYYVNADGSVRWDELGEGSIYTVPFVIDNTAPFIVAVDLDEEANSMEVMAHDNQYIAAVALYTEDGTLIDYYGGFKELRRGEQMVYPFDISELVSGSETDATHFLVEVYDYAENLSTYKINLNPEEENDPYKVTLNTNEASIINKGTVQLTATVTPWGYADEEVVWTSSDESVAVVDDNGLVTSVASADGTAIITATSTADPSAFDTCEVTVTIIHKNLNGIVWDENGEIWVAGFDVGSLPDYSKLNAENLRLDLASMTYDEEGTLYAVQFDSEAWTSDLYTMNPETFETTLVGSSEIGFMDICQAPSLNEDHLLAVYGPYVVIVNKTTATYEGVFDVSSYTGGNYLVGIAYEEQYYHPTYGNTDWVFLLDEAGNIYNTGFLPYNQSYSRFGVSQIGTIGEAVDIPYWQSLYYNGADLFWSRFNEADNKVDIVMVNDLYNDGSIYNMGSFADSVWPVGGLFELGTIPYFGEAQSVADHSQAVIDENAVFAATVEPLEKKGARTSKNTGSLNAKSDNGQKAEPNKISTEVTVELAADELTTNGLITVEVPETAELTSWSSNVQYQAWNDKETGKYTFGFVDLEGIEADGLILKLTFSKDSTGTVTITTTDINEDDEQEVVETVVLGTASTEHTVHNYGEPEWTWAEDYSSATATFTCELGDDTQVIDAVITFEDNEETRERTYTATAEFEGKIYIDTKMDKTPWEPFTWTRLKGSNRYATMAAITQEGFKEANSAKTILVALGTDYVSALLAGGLAGALDAPLLTAPATTGNATNLSFVKAEIERLAAEGCEIIIIGSASEVDEEVKAELAGVANVASVKRLEAESREELAEVLYNYGEGKWTESGTIILANGYNFADTLSVSPYAYYAKTPMFYTNEEHALNASTKTFMASGKVKRVVIVGGDAAVSTETEEELKGMGLEVIRLKGAQRYATSAAIVNWACGFDKEAAFQPDKLLKLDNMAVATGLNSADALASVNVVGKKGSALLLVADNSASTYKNFKENLEGIIKAHKESIYTGYILGGDAAVSTQIEADLNAATAE